MTTSISLSEEDVSHHIQQNLCQTRAPYRQGRKLTAVKVYTVANESQHLHIYGVPKINLRSELKAICHKYGQISTLHVVQDPAIETEAFTECYHVCYQRIQSARIAKRFLDNKSFYGGVLHVCYTPEYETIQELKYKLEQRRYDVLKKLQGDNDHLTKPNFKEVTKGLSPIKDTETSRKRKRSVVDITEERLPEVDPLLATFDKIAQKDIPNKVDQKVKTTEQVSNELPIKHYEINNAEKIKSVIENVPKKVKIAIKTSHVYGPQLPTNMVLNQGEDLDNLDDTITTKQSESDCNRVLIPTQVVLSKEYIYKNTKKNDVNKFVFRKT